jgi:quinol monooxygenase YgiN
MSTMFVRHAVADYQIWRRVYDSLEATRKANGVTAQAVYQSADNPNEITVVHDFPTVAAARAFAGSPELKEGMKAAGVVGAPTIWFANQD